MKARLDNQGYLLFDGDPLALLMRSGDQGRYLASKLRLVDGVVRTKGAPSTMSDLLARYRPELERSTAWLEQAPLEHIKEAARERPLCVIACGMAMVGVESVYSKDQRTRDIFSIRFEPAFEGWAHSEAPRWFSAGLAQTTLKTARGLAKRYGLEVYDLKGAPREVQPGDLCIPEVSLSLMWCKIDADLARYGLDPIRLRSAYNAGTAKPSDSNDFGYILHGGNVGFIKFAAWFNDAMALLLGEAK